MRSRPAQQLLLAVLSLLLITATGCVGGEAKQDQEEAQRVRGQVIEVIARTVSEVETLRVRDDSGQEYSFTSEGFIGFTPSHLKQHQLFGRSVLVLYVQKEGMLVALEVTD